MKSSKPQEPSAGKKRAKKAKPTNYLVSVNAMRYDGRGDIVDEDFPAEFSFDLVVPPGDKSLNSILMEAMRRGLSSMGYAGEGYCT